MFPNHHPYCIDTSGCEYLGGLFQHLVEKRINTNKRIKNKTCQVAIFKKSDTNQDKTICKAR